MIDPDIEHFASAQPRISYDVLIRGGTLLDGSGGPPRRADVGIVDDRIVAIGDLAEARAGRLVDASGLHVAPGFIDIHTHSDISVGYHPEQQSAIAMGVTTQVVGNCGLSMGFANRSAVFEFEKRWLAPHGARITWNNFEEHLQQIEQNGVATNFVPLAGHGTLRKRVMGMEDRAPDAEEMLSMQRELEAALSSGVWGLSSGLEYPPSAFADVAELADLCRVVRGYGGLYATHLRNEGDTLVEAVQEALEVTERAGVPLQLSHHKAEGPQNWGKVRTTLRMVDEARERGQDVQLDQYPYTAFMTALAIQVLPRSALSGAMEAVAERLIDPEWRAEIAAQMRASHPDWERTGPGSFWQNLQIGVCRGRPDIQGGVIGDLAREAGLQPIDYVLQLLAETEGYVSAVNFAIGEEDIAEVLRYPFTSIGSDGVGTHPGGTTGADQVHPRAYGTFPRVLSRYVAELKVLTEAEAIHRMTGLPAARMGIKARGLLRPGYFADLVVYDPIAIRDPATFEEPHQFAEGISAVIVNGRFALEAGAMTGARAGKVLRKTE